jgi:2,3-dihydroxy-p-cumate/2,3-dihydroxybenzoate 3,4-dioxygenase
VIDLRDISSVRLGTRDLALAVQYATEILGLQVSRHEAGRIYRRSDARDHTLCYFDGDPQDHTVAFEVDSAAALESAARQLEQAGIAVTQGRVEEREMHHVHDLIKFKDLNGTCIELILRPESSGWRYFPERDAGITGFSHIGLCSSDLRRDRYSRELPGGLWPRPQAARTRVRGACRVRG